MSTHTHASQLGHGITSKLAATLRVDHLSRPEKRFLDDECLCAGDCDRLRVRVLIGTCGPEHRYRRAIDPDAGVRHLGESGKPLGSSDSGEKRFGLFSEPQPPVGQAGHGRHGV